MKKWVNVSLVTALSVGMLAGCGGGTKTDKADTGKDSGTKAPAKFTISMPSMGNKYAESSPDINNDKWVQNLEKLANVDMTITMLPLKDFDQKMAVMFAGGEIPEVVVNVGGVVTKGMSGSVEAGVFQPLDDLLKQYGPNLLKKIPKEAWEETSYKGKIYGIPNWLDNPSRRGTYIRTDLLEKAGLKAPKTVDEYLNVMRAFKKMGMDSTYQLRENFKYADGFFGAFDTLGFQFELQNGQVVPKFFDTENMTKALTTYKTMYDEGLIPKDFATITSSDYSKSIEAGKAGMWTANAASLPNFRTKIAAAVPGAKVDIIPSPVGPDGKGGYGLYSRIIISSYINAKVKPDKAADIIKYYDWMMSDEAAKFFSVGVEGENYTMDNGKINYKTPKTSNEVDEEGWRENLWFSHESTYNHVRAELSDDGKAVKAAFDNVLSKEGRGNITFAPDLAAFSKYPDLAPTGTDTTPKLIIDHMVKMIYGKEPISDWPKVIEEYKNKGGNDIIKEATDRYNKKEGVINIK